MEIQTTQPSLLDPAFSPTTPTTGPTWAGIAEVVIDSPLPHLDRVFDYGIPLPLADQVHEGSRVNVTFAGRKLDGYVTAIRPASGISNLKPIRRVVGKIPVITPEVLDFCRTLAERYAGGLADVLRLAVPPRHATIEREMLATTPVAAPVPVNSWSPKTDWEDYPAGSAFLRRLEAGEAPRAVWAALPSPGEETPSWAYAIARAAYATMLSGRGVLIVVPTAIEISHVEAALTEHGLEFTVLTADLGPSVRYRNFLHTLRGGARIVLGTRAAIYAPVSKLGLIICWDESHDAHHEPRAPYPHSREALAIRAVGAKAAALFGGYARSPQAQHFIQSGWAHHLGADRSVIRSRTPRVRVGDEYDRDREGGVGQARIPGFAWRKIQEALKHGPVLIQVPRRGYVPTIRCLQCHDLGRCAECHGSLSVAENSLPSCSWCGRDATNWRCPNCDSSRWRATQIGAGRTAEELGRAFPGIPVRVSGAAAARLDIVAAKPALIIATPGAEPTAAGGYALVVLLDGALLTDAPRLNAPSSALHRWLRAASLTSSEVLLLGDPLPTPAQALVRWDPVGYATRVLHEWSALGFPPATTVVSITGDRPDVAAFERLLEPNSRFTHLGPVMVDGTFHGPGTGELKVALQSPQSRLLITAPASIHAELASSIRSAIRTRSARHVGNPLKVRVNPIDEL